MSTQFQHYFLSQFEIFHVKWQILSPLFLPSYQSKKNFYNPSLEVGIEPTTVTFTVVRLYYYAIAVFIINFDSNQQLTIYKLIISFYGHSLFTLLVGGLTVILYKIKRNKVYFECKLNYHWFNSYCFRTEKNQHRKLNETLISPILKAYILSHTTIMDFMKSSYKCDKFKPISTINIMQITKFW